MQYLLSQEEMDAARQKLTDMGDCRRQKLQEFCTFVANNLILTEGWAVGRAWGCILTPEHRMNYCDKCPAQEICPNQSKHWSK